mmetsp:Transcript_295/g.815  ORF Transcript_295/g.815 Transcript_295/m.815 type:complete len:309 (-) Transcript_295:848-1774(-)
MSTAFAVTQILAPTVGTGRPLPCFLSSEAWRSPSEPTPTSTKRPNGAAFLTTACSNTSPARTSARERGALATSCGGGASCSRGSPHKSGSQRSSTSAARPPPGEAAPPPGAGAAASARRRAQSPSANPPPRRASWPRAPEPMPAAANRARASAYASGWTRVASSGSASGAPSEAVMRRKPAMLTYVLGPMPGTCLSDSRLESSPAVSMWARSADAVFLLRPATRCSNEGDAPFTSTPTAATASSTAASSRAPSSLAGKSRWYIPTPSAAGSILTNSDSGSAKRRAIETAARCCSGTSPSSAAARSDAE